MNSGRKQSVIRHIRNPRIHNGHSRVIPFVEYVAGVQSGIYRPADSVFRQKYRDANGTLLTNPSEHESYFDKHYRKVEEKKLEREADTIVNPPPPSIFYKMRSTANVNEGTKGSSFSFARQDVFGISGYICKSCFTMKPAIFLYSNNHTRSPTVKFIDPCLNCNSQMTNEEKKHFLDYNLCNGITPLLFNWIKVYWPQDQKMKLITIRVNKSEIGSLDNYPETLPQRVNYSSARQMVTRLRIDVRGKFPSLIQKSVMLVDEPILEVSSIFQTNPDQTVPHSFFDSFPVVRAIEESEYAIASERDICSFLHYTRFKTFGLFRLNFDFNLFGNEGIEPVNEDEIYLVLLVPDESSLSMCYSCETNHEIEIESAESATQGHSRIPSQ
jgi:hypothetical protein